MTPQSIFMILAPVVPGKKQDLEALLASMNRPDGTTDPANTLVPFGRFDRLHVARFVILRDHTGSDIVVYDLPTPPWPVSLVFLGDCDGPADSFLAELAERAGPGLREIFACCQGFAAGGGDLLVWMRQHQVRPAATYVNWIGRTV